MFIIRENKMNNIELKKELASKLNYKFNEKMKLVYGFTNDYTCVIKPADEYEITYQMIFCVSKNGNQIDKRDFDNLKKDNKCISSVIVNKNKLFVTVASKNKKTEKIEAIIEAHKICIEYLITNGYKNIDEQTGAQGDTVLCNVKGNLMFIMTSTLETMKMQTENNNVIKKEENVVKGIIGAFLGSIIGAGAIVALGQAGYVAVISGILMAACTIFGYSKLAGGLSKKGIVISVVIMVIMTYIGMRTCVTISLCNGLNKYGNPDFFKVFEKVPELMRLDSKLEAEYIKDLILVFVFTGIGVFGMIRVKLDELKNSSVFEILQ